MSVKVLIGAMLAVTALVVVVAATRSHHETPPVPRALPPEKPWLSKEASAQIVGEDGSMGPVFTGVRIGGPVPPPDVRQRIAEFARANDVKIDLETNGGIVTAVTFDVTYGGCCGYEGADALGLRINRHKKEGPREDEVAWLDDWSTATDDGVYMHGHIRVNRVQLRWQRELTVPELLDRAEGLLGRDPLVVASEEKSRWHEIDPSYRYKLDVPYASERGRFEYGWTGLQVLVEDAKISTVELTLHTSSEDSDPTEGLLRQRWGRPKKGEYDLTWQKKDRTIVAEPNYGRIRVTISTPQPDER